MKYKRAPNAPGALVRYWILFLLACFGCSSAAFALDLDAKINFSIAPQKLASALVEFSRQANAPVASNTKELGASDSPGVSGTMSLREALRALLTGTKLTYKVTESGAIAVGAFSAPSSSTTTGPEAPGSTGHGADRYEGVGTFVEEVLVTGSRIPLTAKQQAQPVEVFTKADMERTGQTTLAGFLNTLPQVSMSSIASPFQTNGSQSNVRLHGLPFGTTLVLIDGQRTEISRFGYLDLGTIPASAIERIEVIPVGSSAIYGSDALAGVVNIVLRKHFDGVEANVKYGAADGTYDGSVDAAFGKEWRKGAVSVIVSDQRQSELGMTERALTSTGDFTGLGGKDYRLDSCDPGNVYALNGQMLPGLGTTSAAIPLGLSGTATIGDFKNAAGQLNRCGPYRSISLLPATQQISTVAAAHYAVTPWLDLFTTVLYSHFQTDAYTASLLSLSGGRTGSYVVSANNPYNPFGQNVGVSWAYGKYDSRRIEDVVRPLMGARGDLPGGWHWEVTGLYAHDKFSYPSLTTNSGAVRTALASSDPATALNVFASGVPGSQQLLNSLYAQPLQRFDDSLAEEQAIVRGPVIALPAGPVQSVFGMTYDRFRIWDQTISNGNLFAPADRSRNAYAVFTEERIPILANEARPHDGEVLALSLAGRYDHSDDFGGKSTWQAGLEWRPVPSLLIRGAYGTAYRAPQLPELYGGISVISTAPITDPNRGGAAYSVPYTSGANPDLQPETGASKSLGVVYSSQALEGLESSLTWWSVDYSNYIATANYQDLVSYPSTYPAGLVVRAAQTPDDIANGYLGTITAINSTYVNFGSIDVAGLDFASHYRIPTAAGTWTPAVALTETYKYAIVLRPGQPVQNYVSQASTTLGFAPRWKGNLSLNWERGAWSANLMGRYLGTYKDYAPYAPPDHELGNFWLFDTNIRYRIGDRFADTSFLKDSYISLGGVNIFNKPPQFSYYVLGYDYQEADMRGRFVYLQAGARF